MRVRTKSGTVYSITEEMDEGGPIFGVLRESETAPNRNDIHLGYYVTTRNLKVKVGERIEVEAGLYHEGLRTTPVVEILADRPASEDFMDIEGVMANVKHVSIRALVPFDFMQDAMTGDAAAIGRLLLTPTIGLVYRYEDAGYRPNLATGGQTKLYRLHIVGQEAMSYPSLDSLKGILTHMGAWIEQWLVWEEGE